MPLAGIASGSIVRAPAPASGKGPATGKKTPFFLAGGDPHGGWVGRSTKKGWNQIFFDIFLYRVSGLPLPRNTQKRDKTNGEKISFGFLVEFFVKPFRHDVFCKTFFCVFLNSHR
jgi:hypothetical protein